jgi:hypothetical protein
MYDTMLSGPITLETVLMFIEYFVPIEMIDQLYTNHFSRILDKVLSSEIGL